MVRVLAVADELVDHFGPRTWRDMAPDVLVSAGDLPWDYLELLVEATGAPLVFVPGNHDPELPGSRPDPWARLDPPPSPPRGAHCADGTVVEVAGLRIAGLGGCVRYRPGPHQYTQEQHRERAQRLLRQADGRADVLLTHAPPLGLGDEADRPHQGIESLHDVLDQLRPSWHLHGHIHPYGRPRPDRTVGPTTVRNVVPWSVVEVEPRSGTADPLSR